MVGLSRYLKCLSWKIDEYLLYLALYQVQMVQMETRKRDWTRPAEHLFSVEPLTLLTCSNRASWKRSAYRILGLPRYCKSQMSNMLEILNANTWQESYHSKHNVHEPMLLAALKDVRIRHVGKSMLEEQNISLNEYVVHFKLTPLQ